jgi:hypothetical protein
MSRRQPPPPRQGRLADTDARWDTIAGAVDDRTPAERGLLGKDPEVRMRTSLRWGLGGVVGCIACVLLNDVGTLYVFFLFFVLVGYSPVGMALTGFDSPQKLTAAANEMMAGDGVKRLYKSRCVPLID